MRDRSGFGWLALIVSILLVLLGIATFIWPEAALESFVMVYGVLAVATGIMDIAFYARVERHTGFGPMTALGSGILTRTLKDSGTPGFGTLLPLTIAS